MKNFRKCILVLFSALMLAFLPMTALPGTAMSAAIPVSAATVKLNYTSKTLYTKKTVTLKLKNASGTVTWKSDDETVAKVSSKGKVTALKKGTAVISATCGKKVYKCTIKVKDPYLSSDSLTIDRWNTETLTLKGATAASYSSSDWSVVTVTDSGKLFALDEGKAVIKVTDTKDRTYKCTVYVNDPDEGAYVSDEDWDYTDWWGEENSAAILVRAEEVLDSLELDGKTDLEKLVAIHDYIALNTAYAYDEYLADAIPDECYSVEGVLFDGKAVCQGYAETFDLLAKLMGFDCFVQSGEATNSSGSAGGHAWNTVKLDGKWYQVDVTWDDPTPDRQGYVRYSYFLVSDLTLGENHTWTWHSGWQDYGWGPIECNEDYNYQLVKYQDCICYTAEDIERVMQEQYATGQTDLIFIYPMFGDIDYYDVNSTWFRLYHSTLWAYSGNNPMQLGDYYMYRLVHKTDAE